MEGRSDTGDSVPSLGMGRAGREARREGAAGPRCAGRGWEIGIERALSFSLSLLVTKETAGASLWGWEL